MRARVLASTSVSAALLLATAIGLSGCSLLLSPSAPAPAPTSASQPAGDGGSDGSATSAALDNYVALEVAAIPQIFDANPGVYSDIQITGEAPGTVVYEYTYAETQDADAVSTGLDAQKSTFQSQSDAVIFPAMHQVGVESPLATRFSYFNADGSQIWSEEFPES